MPKKKCFLCLDWGDKEVREAGRGFHSRYDAVLCEDSVNMSRDGCAV